MILFERERPEDRRPRHAVESAHRFADGGERTTAIRAAAWAAMRAAQEAGDAGQPAASDAARAALAAAGAPYLLPNPGVVDVLRRHPAAPQGGGRVGELIRDLDASLR